METVIPTDLINDADIDSLARVLFTVDYLELDDIALYPQDTTATSYAIPCMAGEPVVNINCEEVAVPLFEIGSSPSWGCEQLAINL